MPTSAYGLYTSRWVSYGFVCGAKVMDHSRYNCVTSCMRNKIEILNYCYISFCTLSFHLLSVNPKISGGCLNDRDIFLEKVFTIYNFSFEIILNFVYQVTEISCFQFKKENPYSFWIPMPPKKLMELCFRLPPSNQFQNEKC